MISFLLISALLCGGAAAYDVDGVLEHNHSADYASSMSERYCSLCDLAAKVNALPAASDISEDNAFAVELQLIAIDQLKYKVFSINDEDYYEVWLSLLNEKQPNPSGNGYPIPSQYVNASEKVLEVRGSLVKVVIEKRYMPIDGQAVNAVDAQVVFSLTKEGGSPQIFTLSTVNPDFPYSYANNDIYSEVLDGSTLTGWQYTLYLPAGTYTITEIDDSGAALSDGTPFVTGSTTVQVDGGAAVSGKRAEFTVGGNDGGTVVMFTNERDPSVTISVVDADDSSNVLEGAHIQILDHEGNVVKEWDSTTDNPWEITGLTVGEEYTLRVTVAPDGYAYPADTKFKLKNDGNIDEGTTDENGYLLIELSQTKVEISAVDVDDSNNVLADAHIQVIGSDGTVVDEWDSTTDTHEVKVLTVGEEYTLRVTVAPDGYAYPADTKFKLKNDGNIDEGTTDENGYLLIELSQTKVEISAVDVDDSNNVLADAHIQVIGSDGTVVDEWDSTTDTHEVKVLTVGEEYTLRVTTVPDGYACPADTTFKLKNDGTINTDDTTATVNGDDVLLVQLSKTTQSTITFDTDCGSATDTGSGNYSEYPRTTENGGEVGFGTSPVVIKVVLPDGTTGSVTLITNPETPETGDADVYYDFALDIPNYPENEDGKIIWRIPTSLLDEDFGADDYGVYIFEDGEWKPLDTVWEENGTYHLYTTGISSGGNFIIVKEKGAAEKHPEETPVIKPEEPPKEEPSVPGEVLPPISGDSKPDDKEEKEPTIPVLGISIGLLILILIIIGIVFAVSRRK